jgi:tetratricopeptide (TPR) repeat protein
MGRWVRWVSAAAVVAGAVALAVGVGRAAGPRAGGVTFLSGAFFLTLGTAVTAAHLAGIAPATTAAHRSARSGWVGIALGAAMLGLVWVDGWVATESARQKVQVALERGHTAAKAGDWAGAADAYAEAVRLDPDNADALRRRGAAYLHLGEYDRALADLDMAARLTPSDVGVVYNRGLARAQLGDAPGAVADFSEVIRLDPTLARAWYARGNMHAKLGNAVQAEADWRRATELDPALNKGSGLDL